jgi:hypothetical protein
MNAFSASVKGPCSGRTIIVEAGVLAEAGRSDEGDSVAIVEQTNVTVTSRSSDQNWRHRRVYTDSRSNLARFAKECHSKSPSGFKLAIVLTVQCIADK